MIKFILKKKPRQFAAAFLRSKKSEGKWRSVDAPKKVCVFKPRSSLGEMCRCFTFLASFSHAAGDSRTRKKGGSLSEPGKKKIDRHKNSAITPFFRTHFFFLRQRCFHFCFYKISGSNRRNVCSINFIIHFFNDFLNILIVFYFFLW